MLTTPSGTPASTSSSPSFSTEKQESSEGFSTTLHPAARAGAIFQEDCVSGPFQGTMSAATPMGSRTL